MTLKQLIILLFFCTVAKTIDAQYYYQDILLNQQSNQYFAILKSNNVKKIIVKNIQDNTADSNNMIIEQTINDSATLMQNKAMVASTIVSTFVNSYDSFARIIGLKDEHDKVESVIKYYYKNGTDKLDSIVSVTSDTGFDTHAAEKHIWKYNAKNYVDSMYKIKNGKDTTVISFIRDENGLPVEEKWVRNKKITETYYYYYNDKKQLTDIVRFNIRVRKLLPDFMFEYDEQNRVKKMTQVPAGSSNYTTWEYYYDDKGRKTKELCRNKINQAIGKIIYSYQ